MDIPRIEIPRREIGISEIPRIYTPEWLKQAPTVIPPNPPVTQQIGVPIINIPGCVEAHETNNDKNRQIVSDDPKGVRVYCDAGVPSYRPIDYDRNKIKFQPKPVEAPKLKSPEIPAPTAPNTKNVVVPQPECPTEAQKLKEPIGTFTENGTKKIISYKLVGKECIPITENVTIPDQIVQAIPSAGSVTTTASIAVVATTSALLAKPLADLVLKAVKPTVKKVIKKIAAIRGKSSPVESLMDRRDQQRLRNHAIRKLKGKE